MKGKRLDRIGAKGFIPTLFQIVEVRDGKIVRMQDYAKRGAAMTAAGLDLRRVPAAAFFDLDRTLLRRSSALALAGSFRERGLISRRQLLQAALWQLLFVARGASHEAVRRGAEDGLRILAGYRPEDLRELVAEAMEPVLRPLVYAEPLRLVERHRERGERVYIISATLQEIVEAIADDLGFDGALGTICEVRDGRYTGRAVRALHAEAKADVRAGAGSSARASTSPPAPRTPTATPTCRSSKPSAIRSRSTPIASCGGSRGIAAGRCSSSARAPTRMRAVAFRPPSSPPARRVQRPFSPRGPVDADEGLSRLRALGFGEADAQELWAHFDAAERRGKQGHGHARIPWLEGLEGYDPSAEPALLEQEDGFQRWHGRGAIGYLVLGRVVRAQLELAAGARRASSSASARSRRGCSATTCGGSPKAASSAC